MVSVRHMRPDETRTGIRTMNAANKNAEISRRILAKIAEGMTLRAAFDAVMGEGRYNLMIGDLYETLVAECIKTAA